MHMLPKTRALRDRRFRHYRPLMYLSRDPPRELSHALPNLITTMRSVHAVDRDLETAIRILMGGRAKRGRRAAARTKEGSRFPARVGKNLARKGGILPFLTTSPERLWGSAGLLPEAPPCDRQTARAVEKPSSCDQGTSEAPEEPSLCNEGSSGAVGEPSSCAREARRSLREPPLEARWKWMGYQVPPECGLNKQPLSPEPSPRARAGEGVAALGFSLDRV